MRGWAHRVYSAKSDTARPGRRIWVRAIRIAIAPLLLVGGSGCSQGRTRDGLLQTGGLSGGHQILVTYLRHGSLTDAGPMPVVGSVLLDSETGAVARSFASVFEFHDWRSAYFITEPEVADDRNAFFIGVSERDERGHRAKLIEARVDSGVLTRMISTEEFFSDASVLSAALVSRPQYSRGQLFLILSVRTPGSPGASLQSFALVQWHVDRPPQEAVVLRAGFELIGRNGVLPEPGVYASERGFVSSRTGGLMMFDVPVGTWAGPGRYWPFIDYDPDRGWLFSGDTTDTARNEVYWLRHDGSVRRIGRGRFARWLSGDRACWVISRRHALRVVRTDCLRTTAFLRLPTAPYGGYRMTPRTTFERRGVSAPVVTDDMHLMGCVYETERGIRILMMDRARGELAHTEELVAPRSGQFAMAWVPSNAQDADSD